MSDTIQPTETTGTGSTISYSLDGTTYTELGDVIDITPPKITAPEVKTTALKSTAETSQGGTPDYGEAAVTAKFKVAVVSTILGWIKAKKVVYIKILVKDGDPTATPAVLDTFSKGQAWVKDYTPIGTELKQNTMVEAKLTLKITGEFVLAPNGVLPT